MIEHRPVSQLGGGDFGWLKALHHFHIGSHGNPAHRALGNLYVWNDDDIAPGTGFPAHSHRDVEIITYVREGFVSHKDSVGGVGQTSAGNVQVMSAGTGIEHAEVGAPDQQTKIFQIWLHPRERGGEPRWGTKPFPKSNRAGRLIILASGFAEDVEALAIRADARVLGATLESGNFITYPLAAGRKAYLVTTTGKVIVNGVTLNARDGVAIVDESEMRVQALTDTELVMVDAV